MTQHKMHVIDGVRYRYEDLPDWARKALEDAETVAAKSAKDKAVRPRATKAE